MACEKRKKVVLSIEQKLEALKRIHKGESMLKITSELGGGETLGDWKRKRSELEKWCSDRSSDQSSGLKDRKTMKKCEYEKVSEALFLWFTQQRDKGMPITGLTLQEKALSFQKECNEGEPDLTGSVGWLDHWKKRYGLRQLSICANFHCLIENEGLSSEQIYNCDETSLNYKMMPSKTLASRAEASASGYKRSKERVTILACSNATGNYKLKLTFIGKAKKPTGFQKHSTYLLNLPRKAILVIDNSPSHPHEDELISGNIRVIFLPPNIISLCQPMDQGVLEALKKKYRHKLLTTLIEATDDGNCMLDKLRTVNIKYYIYWIAQPWEKIVLQTLARSWRKLLSEDENTQEMVQENFGNLLPLLQQFPGYEKVNDDNIQEWLEKNEQQELMDRNIITHVNRDDNDNEDDEDTNDNDKMERISHTEGVKDLEAALAYVKQQGVATASDVILLRRWRDFAARKRNKAGKQT
uniref:HTH CENPB-type domain-containing protein n=1 Tax=Pelodiscus sinensis TaxID=13735 RepID=K7FY89_PELSI